MLFTIHITSPRGSLLLSDLFFMDSLTELKRSLYFLDTGIKEGNLESTYSIQISRSEMTVVHANFQTIEKVQQFRSRIYERIIQKQYEYIAQNGD